MRMIKLIKKFACGSKWFCPACGCEIDSNNRPDRCPACGRQMYLK